MSVRQKNAEFLSFLKSTPDLCLGHVESNRGAALEDDVCLLMWLRVAGLNVCTANIAHDPVIFVLRFLPAFHRAKYAFVRQYQRQILRLAHLLQERYA